MEERRKGENGWIGESGKEENFALDPRPRKLNIGDRKISAYQS